jgi:hypothetical protein
MLVHIITTTETTLHNTQTNDPKIKIQKLKYHGLSTLFIYSYIIREVREREIRKKEESERIKIKNRPSQLQMVITFDWKFRLRRSTRPRKAYDEIYRVNVNASITIFGAKKHRLQAQKRI